MMSVVKQVRSLRGEYKMTNKQKAKVYLETKNEQSKTTLLQYTQFISLLTSADEVIFTNEIPAGCVITVINDEINAHLMLKVSFFNFILKRNKNPTVVNVNVFGNSIEFYNFETVI